MTSEEIMAFPYDPWMLLGVQKDADDEDVALAWKNAGAPDSGVLFEAYSMLKDEVSRWKTTLLGPTAYQSASGALKALKRRPVYVGPGAWYQAIAREGSE